MGKENPVLVLGSGYDPQFAVLNELPHTEETARWFLENPGAHVGRRSAPGVRASVRRSREADSRPAA